MKFRASIIQTPGRLLQVYGQIPPISAKYINHNVGNEGFSCTSVGCLNEGVGVVVMTNSDNSSIIEEIVNSSATVYKS